VQTRSVECRHRAQSADIVHCKKTFFIIKTLEGHSSFYADIVDRVQTQRAEWVSSADMLHQTHIRGTFCIIKKSEIFFIIYRHFSQSADTACRVGLECRHSSRAPLFACILYMGIHSCRYICILTMQTYTEYGCMQPFYEVSTRSLSTCTPTPCIYT